MSIFFSSACACFIGCGRENNEDNFYFNKKCLPVINSGTDSELTFSGNTDGYCLFAVFDGLGGEKAGEKAAYRASEAFSQEYDLIDRDIVKGKEFFLRACEKAHKGVKEISREEKGTVGSTVASLLFFGDSVVSCNVGDSRIYRIRDRKMMMISEDHTDAGIISALGINKRPELLQFLGADEKEIQLDPFITKGNILSGDTYILCSDGVSDVLSHDGLYNAVKDKDALLAVKSVINEVQKKNGGDNATVVVINFK